ncbi:MAG: Rieske (2Fe-2S) protein [Magnetospiraceae bacterium]
MPDPLCALADLEDPGSAAFEVKLDGKETRIMVIRKGDQVVAYENACPHTGAPLDTEAGRFLDYRKEFILCTLHGAMFAIEDGSSVWGPTGGKGLSPVSVKVVEGKIQLAQ